MPESHAEAVRTELLHYLDGEINNRDLTVTVNGEEWDMVDALFRTSGPLAGELELVLENGKKRRGISLQFEITDDQALPDAQ